MTKNERNLIKVLKAMSENSFAVAMIFEKDANEYDYNMSASSAYESAIRMIKDKKSLQRKAEIFSVELE